ncbi:DUF2656 domain-containing protein [Oscillatoriales cyanobacterium LEGE 11467]|uniref:DUF2656 domain-containing protein n=1 Tax=Zarconia navalis LEGE 11467 TaxID=1828826 RepID=A0A928W3Z7_9CYAN|nr:DUF2656 domain-containing protein [Zarconia navalis]MBE9042765.1 DUF2656 domain-containing protein [Zarconia navalis LEGE 11467]
MTESLTGRMLLSHNFDLQEEIVPKLTREQFSEVFEEGLGSRDNVACQAIEHPHWIVEVRFDSDRISPEEVGQLCATVLWEKRQTQKSPDRPFPHILILAGCKTTPASSPSPTALQPGEWGVDVVETPDAEIFLQALGWEAAIAGKAPDAVFKVERR